MGQCTSEIEVVGTEITLVVFRVKFLEKYFLEDVHSKKCHTLKFILPPHHPL